MVTKASFCIFNKHDPKPFSIGKVVHHTNYRGTCTARIYTCLTIPLVLLSDQLEKYCLFGKVTYVTALIWTYIPYMIHQSYHHTPRTYIDRLNVLIEENDYVLYNKSVQYIYI